MHFALLLALPLGTDINQGRPPVQHLLVCGSSRDSLQS